MPSRPSRPSRAPAPSLVELLTGVRLELEDAPERGELEQPRAAHRAIAARIAEDGSTPARVLAAYYAEQNRAYFAGELGPALVLLTPPKSARTLGDYAAKDPHGLESRIRIAPRLVRRGVRYLADVLLHEMVHAWQHEILGDEESGYKGHGPRFAEKCNEIGERLRLPKVGVKGRGGLPDCAGWPLNVRPDGYYPPDPSGKPKAEAAPAGDEGERDDGDRDAGDGGDVTGELAERMRRARIYLGALARSLELAGDAEHARNVETVIEVLEID